MNRAFKIGLPVLAVVLILIHHVFHRPTASTVQKMLERVVIEWAEKNEAFYEVDSLEITFTNSKFFVKTYGYEFDLVATRDNVREFKLWGRIKPDFWTPPNLMPGKFCSFPTVLNEGDRIKVGGHVTYRRSFWSFLFWSEIGVYIVSSKDPSAYIIPKTKEADK